MEKKEAETTGKKFDYKKIKFDEMKEFIETQHPGDKSWFKEVAYSKQNGSPNLNKKGAPKYNHLNAKRRFFEKYFPDELPTPKEPKEPVNVDDKLKDW